MFIFSFRHFAMVVTGLFLATPSFAQDYGAVLGQKMAVQIITEGQVIVRDYPNPKNLWGMKVDTSPLPKVTFDYGVRGVDAYRDGYITADSFQVSPLNQLFWVDDAVRVQGFSVTVMENSGATYLPVKPPSSVNLWDSSVLEQSNFTVENAVYRASAEFDEMRINFDAASLAKALGETVPKGGL
jgi:hypothetical protein